MIVLKDNEVIEGEKLELFVDIIRAVRGALEVRLADNGQVQLKVIPRKHEAKP